MTLLERIQNINANAVPVAADRRAVLLAIDDGDTTVGYIEVVADGVAIGVFTTETWNQGGTPEAVLVVDSDDAAVNIVEYLATYQPEGTDWLAWACQRIDDDGPDLAGPLEAVTQVQALSRSLAEPDENLAIQWQDSAPDMDYDTWLDAEIEIQLELLEDVPKDDYVGLAAAYDYIVDIQAEIRRRHPG